MNFRPGVRAALTQFIKNPTVETFDNVGKANGLHKHPFSAWETCGQCEVAQEEDLPTCDCPISLEEIPGEFFMVCGFWYLHRSITEDQIPAVLSIVLKFLAWKDSGAWRVNSRTRDDES